MSPRFSISKDQALSLLRGTGYAAGGAIAAYLLGALAQVHVDPKDAWMIVVCQVLLNAAYKFFSGPKTEL